MNTFPTGTQVSMRGAVEGHPHPGTAVGTVLDHGITANNGTPYILVNWPGCDGGTDAYHPSRLVRVTRDTDGTPRAI